MQLKHNVSAPTHIHNPKCYCSTAARLWSNLNSESIFGGALKLRVCLVLLQRVNPQSRQPQVLHLPTAGNIHPKFLLMGSSE